MVASTSTTMPPVMLSPSQAPGDSAPVPRPPTQHELWRWCVRADAVAQCYIRDVMQLKEPERGHGNEQDMFWWLGTVPCRCVRFVGMLVEANAYEKRTMYTVDDGTGVILCVHPHPSPAQDKQRPKRHAAPALESAPDFPKPRYEIGDILGVTGRVQTWRDARQILVNEIELCRPNDEPQHWITTAKLHESYYSKPFVIPPLPPAAVPKTPVKSARIASASATPNTASTVRTPSTASSTSSACTTGPARLRHPSRLRSKELIASTFKIYLKNYMDVLSDPSRPVHDPSKHFYNSASAVEESPTKRLKCRHDANFATPKPRDGRLRSLPGFDETPRASDFGRRATPRPATARQLKGFTFSYLRRVPELADMALRVVQAEGKRRAREARRQQKEAARAGKTTAKPPAERPFAEPPNRKAKRLYTWALRELRKEGSIILHDDDAPVWEWSSVAAASAPDIWKASRPDQSKLVADDTDVTASTAAFDVTRMSTTAHGGELVLEPGELSDPPLHEESYVPLMPAMLTEPIVEAIKCMWMRKPAPKPREATANYRSHCVGPTTEELRAYIGQVDARWENVGEYAVADALALLKAGDRVYGVGRGRWELTI